jgi:hypothetical protein
MQLKKFSVSSNTHMLAFKDFDQYHRSCPLEKHRCLFSSFQIISKNGSTKINISNLNFTPNTSTFINQFFIIF